MVHLLDRYSSAYASIQFRALRQFFKWRAAEDELPDPMTRLRAPKVAVTAVPVFTSVKLSELQKACQGRSFAARRDAAIIAVFTATGIRLSELAGICCHPGDPARSDLDLPAREIRIRGKGGTARTVKIGHQPQRFRGGARSVTDRVVPVFGGCIWFACSRRMADGPMCSGGTGSDCAGEASFPGRRDGVAGQAGAGRAHSRCQQARNASFQGQVRLIFSTRARAWRTSRAGRLSSR